MKSDWIEFSLGEVAEIIGGGTPDTKNPCYWDGNIAWLTPRDLSFNNSKYVGKGERFINEEGLSNSSAKLLPKGTVLLSSRAPIGYLAIAKNPLSTNQGFRNLIPNKKTSSEFLYYLLKNNIEYVKNQASGTTFLEIPGSILKSIRLIFPPIPEQKAITGVLSALDDKIDLLQRQNETLEALAQTLFRQLFIESAEDDWETGFLPEEFDFVMGLSPPGVSYNELGEGTPMYQGNADFQFRYPKNRVFTTDPKRFAQKFDTLISVRAPVGAQNMAFEKCCIGRGVAAFRYKKNPGFYSYTYYRLGSLMDEIKVFDDTGTVFGSINKGNFETLEINIPPDDLIQKFQYFAELLDNKIYLNTKQIFTLENLRDTLLPKLMSGEVRVRDGQDHGK